MVLVGRLLPGLRAALPLSAGPSRMAHPALRASDAPAIALWDILMNKVGPLFGGYRDESAAVLRSSGGVLPVPVVLPVIPCACSRRRNRRSG